MNLDRDAASISAVVRVVSIVHGLITAATVTGVLGIHALGAWLTVVLGRRPHPCVDDIHHWTFQLATWTTGFLFVVAYYGALLWVPATVVEACSAERPRAAHQALALRVVLVLLAWGSLFVDPTGGFNWILD